MENLSRLARFRIKHPVTGEWGDSQNGCFFIDSPKTGERMFVIASSALGWDHLSVSLRHRCPTWSEIEHVKKLFLGDVVAMQLHLPEEKHVDIFAFCLHIWMPHGTDIPLPPTIMV